MSFVKFVKCRYLVPSLKHHDTKRNKMTLTLTRSCYVKILLNVFRPCACYNSKYKIQ
jgi:hypothetical protein